MLELPSHKLYRKYIVKKQFSETDPDAIYIVLRIDKKGDPIWARLCRRALRHLVKLARSLNWKVDFIDSLEQEVLEASRADETENLDSPETDD